MAPVHILMLGDCTLACAYMPKALSSERRLTAALARRYPGQRLVIANEGLDGETIAGFLRRYKRTLARHPAPDYVLIRYGVNDRREFGAEGFCMRLEELCDRLQDDVPGVRIILETGIYVDYPRHYEFDRNRVLQPIYDIIRRLGWERAYPVVDIYERMKRETEAGNWDLRVRGYGVVDEEVPVLGAGQDHLHGDDVRWFTNIHPNSAGMMVIADEEANVFATHWPEHLPRRQEVAVLVERARGANT